MHALSDFFPELFTVSALLLAAIGLAYALRPLGLPGPAAFLAVGAVAGWWGLLPTDALREASLEQIGAVALYAILFQGGLATGFRAWRREAASIVALGTLGTAATAAALAGFAHYGLGLGWALAALVAVALSPTDPAAVYATLRAGKGSTRPRVILEGESGFNDPVAITLMVVVAGYLATDTTTVGDGAVRFVEEMGIGLVGGIVGAALLLLLIRATSRIEDGLQSVAVLAGASAVGAGTATVHGSGFLAVYVAALLVADAWSEQDGASHAIPEAIAAAAEPLLFGLLAAVFVTHVSGGDLARGVALTVVTVAFVRPLAVAVCLTGRGLARSERLVVSLGGLKGAVPLLLAGYPALEVLPESAPTEAIVLCATAASIVIQAPLLRRATR